MSKKNGMGLNPAKTEFVLFTKKHKVDEFHFQDLEEKHLGYDEKSFYI